MAWHELSVGCLNAERKLLELQDAQLQEKQQVRLRNGFKVIKLSR